MTGALLLAVAAAALGAAALRVASEIAEPGLERLVVAAVLFGAAAVIEALAAGLVGLGGSAIVVALLAVATWQLAGRLLPATGRPRRSEVRTWWWRQSSAWERALLGAAGGAFVGLCAILLHRPEPGFDGITYHLPEVVAFVQGGHTGAEVVTGYALPTGAYPLTNEVMLAWLTALSGGFAALTLWTPVCAVVLVAAGWLGLRNAGVADPRVRALALAALVLGPLFVVALPQPGTDLPAVAWLVCCAALCTGTSSRPALLAPAIVALGLAIGTKTTPATLGVPIVAWSLWVGRARLRAVAAPLLAGFVAAVLAGGVWYLRNLVIHGSPLWPFYSLWGDPVPPLIQAASHTLLERPLATLRGHVHTYLSAISGSLVLLAGGAFVPLLAPRRYRLCVAAGAVILSALAWANAPVTGLPDIPALVVGAESSVRYLLPVFAAGACALALAASCADRKVVRCTATAALVGALVWDLVSDVRGHFWLPFDSWLYAGIVAGAGVAVLAGPWVARRVRGQALALCVCVAGVAFLAAGGPGFVGRHALVRGEVDARLEAFFATHGGPARVAAAPFAPGLLAGDSLSRRVSLLPRHAPCAAVLRAARVGLVVLDHVSDPIPIPGHPGALVLPPGSAQSCLAAARPRFSSGAWRVY